MKTPLNWLSEYVDIKGLTPEQISDGLRLSGTENVLESGVQIDDHVVVGEIKEITKHPNADKLQIAIVSIGEKRKAKSEKGISGQKPKAKSPMVSFSPSYVGRQILP